MKPRQHFPRIPSEYAEDLHGLEWGDTCDLVLFMAGNQFMVLPDLIEAFQSHYPLITKIIYETLPPGLELRQILAGGAWFQDRQLSIYPDVYTSVNLAGMQALETNGHIAPGAYRLYLHNRLSLMVPRDNPAGITCVQDLASDEVRISQPDPANEDIALHIIEMYRDAGGQTLVQQIMETKRQQGTTRMTTVHHRQTPERIAAKTVDVGPVWATETIHAATTDLQFDVVEPGAALDQRHKIDYYICRTTKAPHPENATRFVDFICSKEAQEIYQRYGFVPAGGRPAA